MSWIVFLATRIVFLATRIFRIVNVDLMGLKTSKMLESLLKVNKQFYPLKFWAV